MNIAVMGKIPVSILLGIGNDRAKKAMAVTMRRWISVTEVKVLHLSNTVSRRGD